MRKVTVARALVSTGLPPAAPSDRPAVRLPRRQCARADAAPRLCLLTAGVACAAKVIQIHIDHPLAIC